MRPIENTVASFAVMAMLALGFWLSSVTLLAEPELAGQTPPFTQSVAVRINVQPGDDPAGHEPFIGMPGNMKLTVDVETNGDVTITGPTPWVEVSGFYSAGEITASGKGTVAGFSGIQIALTAMLNGETLTGEYRMGTSFGLPQEQPIAYTLKAKPATATPDGPTATPSATSPPISPTPTVEKDKYTFTFTNPGPGNADRLLIELSSRFEPNNLTIVEDTSQCSNFPAVSGEWFEPIVTFNVAWDENCAQPGATFTISLMNADDSLSTVTEEWTKVEAPPPTPEGVIAVRKRMPLNNRDDRQLYERLPGWQIRVYEGEDCQGSPWRQGTTNRRGEFVVDEVPRGLYSVAETLQDGWERLGPSCINTFMGTISFALPVIWNWPIRNGNINGDAMTDSRDVLLILQVVAGRLSRDDLADQWGLGNSRRGDVNEDERLDALDAALTLQLIARLLLVLPAIPPGDQVTPVPKIKHEFSFTNPGPARSSLVVTFQEDPALGSINEARVVSNAAGCSNDPVVAIRLPVDIIVPAEGTQVLIEWGVKCAGEGATVVLSVRSRDPALSVLDSTWTNLFSVPTITPTPPTAGTKHIFSFTNTGEEEASSLEVVFEANSVAGSGLLDAVESVLIVDDLTGCEFPPEVTLFGPGDSGKFIDPDGYLVVLDWDEPCVEAGGKVTLSVLSRDSSLEVRETTWLSEGLPTVGKLVLSKITLNDSGNEFNYIGQGWPMFIWAGYGCGGGAVISLSVNGTVSLSLSPGQYSVLEDGPTPGWSLVSVEGPCQDFDIAVGEETLVEFVNQQDTN